ncbi:MAG: ferredoxin [Cyclobacteriaceae bacterium]|nr:ferredoxin [Cyclobacteriaceae bacterium]
MTKLIHYRSKCIGCGICYEMQPEFWRMSRKDGKASLLRGVEKKGIFQREVKTDRQTCLEVAQACPVSVIKVVGG